MILIHSQHTDPVYNLALEESLLDGQENCILLWQNDNSVILGRNQNVYTEVNLPAAARYHTRIVRRNTGGGAVYHDLGNVNFSLCYTEGTVSPEAFLRCILTFLQTHGVPAVCSGRNDILAQQRKISGCASLSRNGRGLFHGTLLFEADGQRMEELLHVSPRKLESKGISSVRSRVGSIRPYLPPDWDITRFLAELTAFLTASFSACPGAVDEVQVQRLMAEKFSTWAWNYGRSPRMNFTSEKRYAAGEIRVDLEIRSGVIHDCRISGDFIGKQEIAGLEQLLSGQKYDPDVMVELSRSTDLSAYFGTMTPEQWLELLFPFGDA